MTRSTLLIVSILCAVYATPAHAARLVISDVTVVDATGGHP